MSGFPYHDRNQNPSRIESPVHHHHADAAVGHFEGSPFRPSFPPGFWPSAPQNQHAQNQQRQQQYQGNSLPQSARGQLPFVGDFRPQQQQQQIGLVHSYHNQTGEIRPNYNGTFRPAGSTPRMQEQDRNDQKQGFWDRKNMDSYNNQTGQIIRPNCNGNFVPPASTPRTQEHNPSSQMQGFWDRNNPATTDFQRNMNPTRDFSTHNESMDNYKRGNVAASNRFQSFSNETQSSFPAGNNNRQPLALNVMPPTSNIQRPVNMPYQNILHQYNIPPSMQQPNFQAIRQPYGIPARLPWTQNLHTTHFTSSPLTETAAVSEGVLQRQKLRKEADMDRSFVEDWLAKRKIKKERVLEKPKALKLRTFHQELSSYLKCINELTMCRDVLLHFIDTDDQNWKEILEKTLTIKVNLENIQESLFSNQYLDELVQKVQQRKKRRDRQKRLRERNAKEKGEKNRNAIIADQKIDEWRHKIVSDINAKKMVDSLKSEAGQSLTEVRKKISDTTKFLEKFETIKELRGIRRQTALQRGIFIFGDQDQKFEQRIEKGKELLKQRLDLYKDEEKTLRVMLEEEQEQLQKEDENKRRKIMEKEHMRIFGYNPQLESRRYWLQAEDNPISLVQIRRLWDVYIVPGTIPGASPVPDGWVMPEPGMNSTWNKYLRKSKIAS
eukprot:Seg589.2 transcript_id=Seg589.2/GoldUCD/mRNA.D3Y31 product="Programmed cell death protein 7" protein_id=Seg589.2/GoldUCD/D3Y31